MKKQMIKVLALLTAVATISSLGVTSVFAEEADPLTEETVAAESSADAAKGESAEGESGESPAVEMAEAVPAGAGMVTELKAGTHSILVYYPADNANENLPVVLSCTAPLFVVFGDGAFDGESAAAYAENTGLASIAASEGSSVVFMNPLGETWTDEDEGAFEAVVDLMDGSSTDAHANGISEKVNFMTKAVSQGITGTTERMYLYGEGSGAQFVADHYIGSLISSVTYPDGFTMEFDNTITGCTISGVESIEGIEPNDIPVVAIGCSEAVNKVLEENCGAFLAEDIADYAAEYDALIGNHRRQAGVIIPVLDYEAEGIIQKIETFTVQTSPDNATLPGTETHDVSVVTYYAQDLDVAEGNVPLVLCFHGGGNTALFEAMATEWPLIGKENGFITVSVDLHHPNVSATETIELIGQLEEEYSIDPSRIYASGFSMGGVKSWDLYEQYPEVFAGLAPMDASEKPGTDSFGNQVAEINNTVAVPVFYVAGETTPLPEMPCQDQKLIDRIAYLFGINKVVKPYEVAFDAQDTWENPVWGINGDMNYQVTDQKTFTDSTMTVELFQSEDGKYYTALALSGNQSHEVYARNSWAAWDFLSQFSRNEDGSIVIEDVSYALTSDDGSVTDNSYNR